MICLCKATLFDSAGHCRCNCLCDTAESWRAFQAPLNLSALQYVALWLACLSFLLPRFMRDLRAVDVAIGYHVVSLNLDLSDWLMQSRARSAGHDYSACCSLAAVRSIMMSGMFNCVAGFSKARYRFCPYTTLTPVTVTKALKSTAIAAARV